MNIAYFDCIGGASGDMILGALVDVGVDPEKLREVINSLHLNNCDLLTERVLKGSISATQVKVKIPQKVVRRNLSELIAILENSELDQEIINSASSILQRLAEVESSIHQEPLDEIHLHELGGDDTIIDIVGVLVGLRALKVDKIFASSVPLGHGFVRSAHGLLPLPAPATLALLEGCPIRSIEEESELVTPTGAVLLTSIVERFGSFPTMTLKRVGYGAGQRDLSFPNLLRIWIGEATDNFQANRETLVLIETNIDDMNPQAFAFIMDRLFEAGALDVTLTPIFMKKNRPATSLSVLCTPDKSTPLSRIVFEETTTLGLRQHFVERISLPRTMETIVTPFGSIRVKIAYLPSGEIRRIPEYEDCRKAAEANGVALLTVFEKVQQIISDSGLSVKE